MNTKRKREGLFEKFDSFLQEFRMPEYFKIIMNKLEHPEPKHRQEARQAHQSLVHAVEKIEDKLNNCSQECEKILAQLKKAKPNDHDLKVSQEAELKKQQAMYLKYQTEYTKLIPYLDIAKESLTNFKKELDDLSKRMNNVTNHSTKIKGFLQEGLQNQHDTTERSSKRFRSNHSSN